MGAPRHPLRPLRRFMRGACLALSLWLPGAAAACPPDYPLKGMAGRTESALFSNAKPLIGKHENWAQRWIGLRLTAGYAKETDEYGHNVLGPLKDAKTLTIRISRVDTPDTGTCPTGHHLQNGKVFEGIRPLLADLTNDGLPEIITTISGIQSGARVTVFDREGNELASTPPIGRRNRWLALIAAIDLDGDGHVEIAYVDRPHLAKTLRVWRYKDGALREVAHASGFSNHKIGWDYIEGGVRDCGQGPELIVASGDWRHVVAVTYDGAGLHTRALGGYSADAIKRAMDCRLK